jgi:hypothetical protein
MKPTTRSARLVLLFACFSMPHAVAQTFRDDFAGKISDYWRITNEDPSRYSLAESPNHLRIRTTPTDVWALHNDLVNQFTIPVPEQVNTMTVTARVKFPTPPYSHPQQAGIILFGDAAGSPDMDNYVRLTYGFIDGFRRLQRTHEISGSPSDAYFGPSLDIGTNPIWIRLARTGWNYQAFYSLNGVDFTLFDAFVAVLPIAHVGLGAFHSEPYNQSIPVDFDFFEVNGTTVKPPAVSDSRPPAGAVHAYPNVLAATGTWVTVVLDGYVADEVSIARYGGGCGVSAASLDIDGQKVVLRVSSDTSPWDGRFRLPIKVLAKGGAVYKIRLSASDKRPAEEGGPNSGIVDSTYIRIQ